MLATARKVRDRALNQPTNEASVNMLIKTAYPRHFRAVDVAHAEYVVPVAARFRGRVPVVERFRPVRVATPVPPVAARTYVQHRAPVKRTNERTNERHGLPRRRKSTPLTGRGDDDEESAEHDGRYGASGESRGRDRFLPVALQRALDVLDDGADDFGRLGLRPRDALLLGEHATDGRRGARRELAAERQARRRLLHRLLRAASVRESPFAPVLRDTGGVIVGEILGAVPARHDTGRRRGRSDRRRSHGRRGFRCCCRSARLGG